MRLSHLVRGVTAAGCVLAAAITAPAIAAAPSSARPASTVHIGPRQVFGVTVNGHTTDATIRMACFGPTRPGRRGHPLAGQHLGVFIPEVVRLPSPGNTGARGRAIVARIDTGNGRTVFLARFNRLTLAPIRSATKPIPTRPVLPCDGQARIAFTPAPGGDGAASSVVDVTFASQP
jgi:hypothetical protein